MRSRGSLPSPGTPVAARDFRTLLQTLEARGEVLHIRRPVDARFEMPALMQQIDRRRRAYAFSSVKGARFALVGGLFNRIECLGWALGAAPGDPFTAADLDARLVAAAARRIGPRRVPCAPVKQHIHTGADVDLSALPVPTAFALDSGPFITAACGIARNPSSGELNVGIYRTLVLDRNTIAVNASFQSDLRRFYDHAARAGEAMPIALAIGVEPALLMAASCKLPPEQSEIDLAGGLRGEPLEMVACETSDLLVPANAEFVIEGRVDLSRRVENVLGEYAGQYGQDSAPLTEVTAVTHREGAMFHSILAGMNPEHTTLVSVATLALQRALEESLRRALPRIADIHVYLEPKFGSMAHIVLSIAKRDDAEPMALMHVAFRTAGAHPPVSHITKRIIVVDDDVDVHDMNDVEWAISTRVADAGKYIVVPDVASWEMERCARGERGSLRLLVDATADMADREKLRRPVIPGAESVELARYLSAGQGGVA